MSATRLLPSFPTVLVGAIASALSSRRLSAKYPQLHVLKKIIVFILVLNWRSLPGVWHLNLFGQIPILRARLRLHGMEKVLAIAKDPFDTKIVTKWTASIDSSDWLGHLSNSSYPKSLDTVRMKFLIEVCGPSMGVEKIWSPLAQTSFYFKEEIPVLAPYEIELHVVSWDDKWLYYVARFTTAPKRGSKERTLNCVALSRSCFKLRGSRLSIPPARVLSLSGVGPDRSNWERTLRLREKRQGRTWLKYGGMQAAEAAGKLPTGVVFEAIEGWDQTGMESYEARRLAGLEVVGRFGNVEGWQNL